MASYYQTKRQYETAEAKAYSRQREIEDQIRRANNVVGNVVMACGLTSYQWLDQYHAKKEALRNPPRPSKENGHDDEDGREATGPEAAEGRADEGLGYPPQEQGGSQASSGQTLGSGSAGQSQPAAECDGGHGGSDQAAEAETVGASWLEDAYPEAQVQPEGDGARWVREEDTPF